MDLDLATWDTAAPRFSHSSYNIIQTPQNDNTAVATSMVRKPSPGALLREEHVGPRGVEVQHELEHELAKHEVRPRKGRVRDVSWLRSSDQTDSCMKKPGYYSTPSDHVIFSRFFFSFQNLDQIRTSRVHATKVGLGHCL